MRSLCSDRCHWENNIFKKNLYGTTARRKTKCKTNLNAHWIRQFFDKNDDEYATQATFCLSHFAAMTEIVPAEPFPNDVKFDIILGQNWMKTHAKYDFFQKHPTQFPHHFVHAAQKHLLFPTRNTHEIHLKWTWWWWNCAKRAYGKRGDACPNSALKFPFFKLYRALRLLLAGNKLEQLCHLAGGCLGWTGFTSHRGSSRCCRNGPTGPPLLTQRWPPTSVGKGWAAVLRAVLWPLPGPTARRPSHWRLGFLFSPCVGMLRPSRYRLILTLVQKFKIKEWLQHAARPLGACPNSALKLPFFGKLYRALRPYSFASRKQTDQPT